MIFLRDLKNAKHLFYVLNINKNIFKNLFNQCRLILEFLKVFFKGLVKKSKRSFNKFLEKRFFLLQKKKIDSLKSSIGMTKGCQHTAQN
jgi:hypothetical protein